MLNLFETLLITAIIVSLVTAAYTSEPIVLASAMICICISIGAVAIVEAIKKNRK